MLNTAISSLILPALAILAVNSTPSEHDRIDLPIEGTWECPHPDPMPSTLGIKSRYLDGSYDPSFSQIDENKNASQRKVRALINKPTAHVIRLSDLYKRSSADIKKNISACVLSNFLEFSKARSLEDAESEEDYVYKSWIISSLSIAYLKVEHDLENEDANGEGKRWLQRNAHAIKRHYEIRLARGQIGNHAYWGGAAAAAAGEVSGDEELKIFGRRVLALGLSQVTSEGILKRELSRGRRAVHYHFFAGQALASIALVQRTHLSTDERQAFTRLVSAVIDGYTHQDGGTIGRSSTLNQIPEKRYSALNIFLPLLYDRELIDRLNGFSGGKNFSSFFFGGDTRFLIERYKT